MEQNFKSFRREILKATNEKTDGMLLEYDQAMEDIKEYLQERLTEEAVSDAKATIEKKEAIKDKAYLKRKKQKYREMIKDCLILKNMRVKGYNTREEMNAFIEDMVAEIAGYSVLEDAFKDPSISDIYVIDWKTIFVEKGGVNQKYHKRFKNPEHFKNTLDRLLNEAGKQINVGDSKIVDFELYQDRGCATSPPVSPRGLSLTLRKHSEEHITRDQLVEWNVLDEKMSDFLGMLIEGECNLICAGLTGSGKTTTIRALLDHYVTRVNKRMLVCEDTQELFPKNEHTLELVSIKSDDLKIAVPLDKLIITALRLKPKYIVVGEVRGEEAQAAVEAMETGHSTIFTMHGGKVWNIVNRLVTKYLMAMSTLGIDVVERIIGSGVDYIFIQDNIPDIGRKITTITEINYDFENKRVTTKDICTFDFDKNDWVWHSKLAEDKINKMQRRGIKSERLAEWVDK